MGVDGPCVHHHLHHAEHGHRHAHQQATARMAVLPVRARDLERPRQVADASQRAEQGGDRLFCRAPAHHHAARRHIGDHRFHAGQAAQVLLDQPGAGGAADILRRQGDLGPAFVQRAHELGPQFLGVVGGPDGLGLAPRRVVDRPGKAGLVAIEMAEPGCVQGLRQGLAATAAKSLFLAIDAGMQGRLAGRERLSTVEAAHAPGGRRHAACACKRRIGQGAGRIGWGWGSRHRDSFFTNCMVRVPVASRLDTDQAGGWAAHGAPLAQGFRSARCRPCGVALPGIRATASR